MEQENFGGAGHCPVRLEFAMELSEKESAALRRVVEYQKTKDPGTTPNKAAGRLLRLVLRGFRDGDNCLLGIQSIKKDG